MVATRITFLRVSSIAFDATSRTPNFQPSTPPCASSIITENPPNPPMAPAYKRTKPSGPPAPSRTLVLDNGAYTMKAEFSSPSSDPPTLPKIIPNCMARDREKKVYIGAQLERCKDFGEIVFRRPVEKGYLVNWEAEKEIWEHEFFYDKASLHCDPKETGLILTEAPNALPVLQTNCDQVVFEEFGFARYYRCPGMCHFRDCSV